MAITQTQSKHPASVVNMKVGRYFNDGTVSEDTPFTITLGFKPRYVRVVNVTSGDQEEWFEGMADDTAIKTIAAGTRTLSASDGITVSDNGFTVGLDTDIVYTSEQLSWIAIG